LDSLKAFDAFASRLKGSVIREVKQTSWKICISTLSRSTVSDIVWEKLRGISGKYRRTVITSLSAAGAFLTSQADITVIIASSFSTVCRSDCYDPDFRAIRNNAETLPLNFTPCVAEAYVAILTKDELLTALNSCRNTSPGTDGSHNEMMLQLPLAGKEFLLFVYNLMWTESLVPDVWKEGIFILF
jgi:hypothetical protein